MKITMYELFGLIKLGKAPAKIKFNNKIYIYKDITNDYIFVVNDGETREWLSSSFYEYYVGELLKKTVEIIEEDKKIEKIPLPSFEQFKRMSAEERYVITAKEYDLLDELIDEINNLKKEK